MSIPEQSYSYGLFGYDEWKTDNAEDEMYEDFGADPRGEPSEALPPILADACGLPHPVYGEPCCFPAGHSGDIHQSIRRKATWRKP